MTHRRERWEEFHFLTTKKWLYSVARTTVQKGMRATKFQLLFFTFSFSTVWTKIGSDKLLQKLKTQQDWRFSSSARFYYYSWAFNQCGWQSLCTFGMGLGFFLGSDHNEISTVISTVASHREGPGFNSSARAFLCGVFHKSKHMQECEHASRPISWDGLQSPPRTCIG